MDRTARALTVLAGAAVTTGAVSLAALHVLPGSRGLESLSQPLSGYALAPNGWLFDVAVLALAFGLAVLVVALVRNGCLDKRSPARALLTAASLSLVLVVVFPEHDSTGAVRTAGRIHWVAAMAAFGGLSIAPTLMREHRAALCSRVNSRVRCLSAGTRPCFFTVLAVSFVRQETGLPVPAWSFGLVERTLVAFEFAVAGLLTMWAWRGCACEGDVLAAGDAGPRSVWDRVRQLAERRVSAPVTRGVLSDGSCSARYWSPAPVGDRPAPP